MYNGLANAATTGLAFNSMGNTAAFNNFEANDTFTPSTSAIGGNSSPGYENPANPYANVAVPAPYSPLNIPGGTNPSLLQLGA
jgi:hypothetical protein